MKNNSCDEWIELQVPITIESLNDLEKLGHIEHLAITQHPLLTAKIAKGFQAVLSAGQIWLWCEVTRAAISHIVTVPNLKMLDVLSIKSGGKLCNFSLAQSLERFYCANTDALRADDFKEISSCMSLTQIHFPNSTLTPQIVKYLLQLPHLHVLDIEASNLDDEMASLISRSKTIETLELGATAISARGLAEICKMTQLKSLDIWATTITQDDLDLLENLPHLEYLSVGQGYDDHYLDSNSLLNTLEKINSLKRVWFDGINFSSDEKMMLSRKYDEIKISYKDEIITLQGKYSSTEGK